MEKNTATQLLETLGIKNSITLKLAHFELTFNRDDAAFDRFTNEVSDNNRVTPMKDYLLATVDKDSKADLLEVLNVAGVALKLFEKVNRAFVYDLDLEVKN